MDKLKKGSDQVRTLDRGSLRRILKVSDLFAIGYGDLGSSIFYALGITAAFALGATPLALLLAGAVFICTALSYAELSSMFQDSGGSASFARHAFNDLISFIAGWGLLLDYIVTIAISAATIGPYLASLVPPLLHGAPLILFTVGIIALLFTLNLFGIKESTRISFFLMLFTLVTEGVLILLGFSFATHTSEVLPGLAIGSESGPSWHDFTKGVAMAMVAYTGIESIAQLSNETVHASKTVPRAIFVTMIVLLVTYLGLSVMGLSVLTPHDLGSTYIHNPIAGIAEHIPFGHGILIPWVALLAGALLFVAANAGLVGASRLSFNMGEYYQLPRFFYKIHPKFHTPYAALAFFAFAAIAIVVASWGRLSILADLYNFGAQIAFFSTHVSLIVLRYKKPELKRPFKVPLNLKIGKGEIPIPAVLGALATLGVWLLVVVTKPDGRYLGCAWIVFGLAIYLWYRKKHQISAVGPLVLEKVEVPSFQPLVLRKILVPLKLETKHEVIQVACEVAKNHKARLLLVYVLEVPFSLPLDSVLKQREEVARSTIRIAEAIASEYGIRAGHRVVRARSAPEAVLSLAKEEKIDLLVVGMTSEEGHPRGRHAEIDKLIAEASCRVWVCGG